MREHTVSLPVFSVVAGVKCREVAFKFAALCRFPASCFSLRLVTSEAADPFHSSDNLAKMRSYL